MNILEEIADKARERVATSKSKISANDMKTMAEAMNKNTGFPFEHAVKEGTLSFICEIKKASPSKGLIADKFPYIDIAKEYEAGGASAMSVLTEPFYFKGDNEYLREIRKNVTVPLLRKDFTVDEYMIYEAKTIGADAVLLICSILSDEELKRYIDIADGLGLSALVEAHDEQEVKRAVAAGARIIGVNNRDLKTFTVDIGNSLRLRKLVPDNIIFISESGIKGETQIAELAANGVDGVLIGETMMRAGTDRVETLHKFIEAGKV